MPRCKSHCANRVHLGSLRVGGQQASLEVRIVTTASSGGDGQFDTHHRRPPETYRGPRKPCCPRQCEPQPIEGSKSSSGTSFAAETRCDACSRYQRSPIDVRCVSPPRRVLVEVVKRVLAVARGSQPVVAVVLVGRRRPGLVRRWQTVHAGLFSRRVVGVRERHRICGPGTPTSPHQRQGSDSGSNGNVPDCGWSRWSGSGARKRNGVQDCRHAECPFAGDSAIDHA